MFKVIKDFKGSPDGCRVIEFTEGQELIPSDDFPDSLSEVAIKEGWVIKVPQMFKPGKVLANNPPRKRKPKKK